MSVIGSLFQWGVVRYSLGHQLGPIPLQSGPVVRPAGFVRGANWVWLQCCCRQSRPLSLSVWLLGPNTTPTNNNHWSNWVRPSGCHYCRLLFNKVINTVCLSSRHWVSSIRPSGMSPHIVSLACQSLSLSACPPIKVYYYCLLLAHFGQVNFFFFPVTLSPAYAWLVWLGFSHAIN